MKSFKLISPYFYQRRYLIATGVACLMVVDILQLCIPRVIKWAVDDLASMQADTRQLMIYAGEIAIIAMLMALFRFIWRRFLIGTSRVVEREIRNRLFFHIQTLSAGYFSKTKTGDLMAHATNDINNIRMAVGMGVVALTDATFLGIAAVCFMSYINIKLTLFALIPMPVIVWFTRSFGKKMHQRYTTVQETFSELTESVRETYSGIRVVKAFNREGNEAARVAAVSKKYTRENLRLIKITGTFFPLMVLFTNLSLTIVLFLGGHQTILMEITPGDFVAFISYLNLLMWPMMAIGWVTNLIQRGSASIDRINEILMTAPEIVEPAKPVSKAAKLSEITFENVCFSYAPNMPDTPRVLTDINFIAKSGSVLGIVGPQGSGKTTLLKLIPRIYDINDGNITINGIDSKHLGISELRNNIGFVSQEPFLFSGSIRENIIFGESVSEDKIIQAVKAAALYETIQSFPNGLDTVVGEKGIVLSGGQKQRIVLARALIKDPPILLLDDPIGQVDTQTASDIINTIYSLSVNKTIIIVSHRVAAVQAAEKIIVLDSGHIVESGNHKALIAANNYYSKSYAIQRAEELEPPQQ
jgi:ATP-binding cassette subfamily B multidrug efflux pump